jgi:hypothetical protein
LYGARPLQRAQKLLVAWKIALARSLQISSTAAAERRAARSATGRSGVNSAFGDSQAPPTASKGSPHEELSAASLVNDPRHDRGPCVGDRTQALQIGL